MGTESFKIHYCGPELDNGRMDVRELAPALLAVGGLLEEANRVLNGNRTTISVKVRRFEDGSFGVAFEVSQPLLAQAVSLFSGDEVNAAINVLTILGLAGTGGMGLIKLLKWAKGRRPKKAKTLADGNIELDFDEAGHIVTSKPTCDLFLDLKVRVEMENFVRPLERSGIDNIGISYADQRIETISKAEAPYFVAPQPEDDLISEQETVATYSIHSLSFKEENKWRLTDGTVTFFATILDHLFLNKVNQNLVSFSKGDILRVRMKIKTWNTATGLRSEYEVLEVIEHRSAAIQLRLPLG